MSEELKCACCGELIYITDYDYDDHVVCEADIVQMAYESNWDRIEGVWFCDKCKERAQKMSDGQTEACEYLKKQWEVPRRDSDVIAEDLDFMRERQFEFEIDEDLREVQAVLKLLEAIAESLPENEQRQANDGIANAQEHLNRVKDRCYKLALVTSR